MVFPGPRTTHRVPFSQIRRDSRMVHLSVSPLTETLPPAGRGGCQKVLIIHEKLRLCRRRGRRLCSQQRKKRYRRMTDGSDLLRHYCCRCFSSCKRYIIYKQCFQLCDDAFSANLRRKILILFIFLFSGYTNQVLPEEWFIAAHQKHLKYEHMTYNKVFLSLLFIISIFIEINIWNTFSPAVSTSAELQSNRGRCTLGRRYLYQQ